MYRHNQNEIRSIAETTEHATPLTPEQYPYLVNGVPVNEKLYEFMQALQAKNSGLQFGVNIYAGAKYVEIPSINQMIKVFSQLLVYREGDVYAMGRIGYHTRDLNTRSKKTDNDAYTVYSRDITNGKYREYNEAHNTRASTRLTTAVTLALKHLEVCTPREIANESKHYYSLQATNNSRVAEGKLNKVKYVMTRSNGIAGEVLDELLAAKAKGYVFDSPMVNQYILDYQVAQQEYNAQGTRKASGYHVRVYKRAEVAMADILLFNDVSNDVSNDEAPSPVQTIPIADVPDDIAGKLSVLDMLNVEEYVEGVGVNMGQGIYWVDRDEV